jgi:hypothetical protein
MISKVQGLSIETAHVLNIEYTFAVISTCNRLVDSGKPENLKPIIIIIIIIIIN